MRLIFENRQIKILSEIGIELPWIYQKKTFNKNISFNSDLKFNKNNLTNLNQSIYILNKFNNENKAEKVIEIQDSKYFINNPIKIYNQCKLEKNNWLIILDEIDNPLKPFIGEVGLKLKEMLELINLHLEANVWIVNLSNKEELLSIINNKNLIWQKLDKKNKNLINLIKKIQLNRILIFGLKPAKIIFQEINNLLYFRNKKLNILNIPVQVTYNLSFIIRTNKEKEDEILNDLKKLKFSD